MFHPRKKKPFHTTGSPKQETRRNVPRRETTKMLEPPDILGTKQAVPGREPFHAPRSLGLALVPALSLRAPRSAVCEVGVTLLSRGREGPGGARESRWCSAGYTKTDTVILESSCVWTSSSSTVTSNY